jgi:glycosyltransferase involved in cell wall biosynthesis
MPLRILSVTFPFAPVAASSVGGAEQVAYELDSALTRAGHLSRVIACRGSDPRGELVPFDVPAGTLSATERARVQRTVQALVERELKRFAPHVVHFHGVDFHEYLPQRTDRVLVTLHLPPSFYPAHVFTELAERLTVHCVSVSQAESCPRGARLAPTIPNGVPLERFAPTQQKSDYVLVLGRICPEKGFETALDAARRAELPSVLAGLVFPYEAHERYFQAEIVPRLGAHARYVGAVGPEARARWLAQARAVLITSRVPETSSLVAMEALASGTPVIALRVGALPEIIEHGVTGFLARDFDGLVSALGRLDELSPSRCREAAERRFSSHQMTERYLALYAELARARSLAQGSPCPPVQRCADSA